jgi:hypothetical protein
MRFPVPSAARDDVEINRGAEGAESAPSGRNAAGVAPADGNIQGPSVVS